MAEEINESLTQSIKGHELILIQIGSNRFQTSSILDWIQNFLGKGSFVEAAAIGAGLALSLMFKYFYFDGRQIEYLSPFMSCGFCIAKRPTARFAFGNRMDYLVIWFLCHLQGVPLMSFLTAH